MNTSSQSQELNFGCDKCDMRFETLIKLKNHERFLHMKSYASQTEDKIQVDKKVQYYRSLFTRDKNVETIEEFALINEAVNEDREAFEKYSCYYCDNVITSESQ